MARPKLASHGDITATTPDDPAGEAAAPNLEEKQRSITMRLRQDAWKQIKIAAVERGTTAHDLMIEALNDWFTKHGKPPIA
jgi:predicted DNA binding CopG/RHH family protein